MDVARLRELVDRLVASGPKAAHVSASETHEIHDDVLELIEERDALVLSLREAIDWATKFNGRHDRSGGYVSELLPQFTRIGERHREDRLATFAKQIAPSEDEA